jgi:hypothetical protein
MHPASAKFINQLAEIAAHRRKIDVYIMRKYMFTKISVALFNAIGTMINCRIGTMNNYRSAMLEDFQHEKVVIREAITAAQ